jgi:hypothetical protein
VDGDGREGRAWDAWGNVREVRCSGFVVCVCVFVCVCV